MVTLEGLPSLPCLPFPALRWEMHLPPPRAGRAAWSCLPDSWSSKGARNHSLKECSLTGGLVQTPYFTGKLRGGKGPSHHLPAGDSDPGSTLSLSPTDQGL